MRNLSQGYEGKDRKKGEKTGVVNSINRKNKEEHKHRPSLESKLRVLPSLPNERPWAMSAINWLPS